jgi:hypothetical protein
MLCVTLNNRVALVFHTKKPAQNYSVAGFTIRSLTPVVTTWGYQFIASTFQRRKAGVFDGSFPHPLCSRTASTLIALSMPKFVA